MPLGYKYVERSADAQINWAEVGREASGMLLEVNRVREEKKEALAQAQRESLNNLMNSPQGKNQDINGVMNTFAHDLIEQKKIDYDLLTRGKMSVRDYTLKAQNQMDGTKRIFDIGKALQETRQSTLDGIANGTLSSAINVFNRGMVEQYQDMSKLGINVTSPDGSINLGIYEDKIVDDKTVRVLKENIASPNVILGKIAQTVPAFDVNKANSAYIAGLGSKKDYWYEAATTEGAGTITELTGVQFLATLKRPSDIAIVKNINDSINAQVGYYFSDEYKLMDVLGDKLGKYDSTSFTFDKNIADANNNKILVAVNPSTGMTSLDTKGKNYKKQYNEAADFVRTDILAKMDAERTIKTTAQNQETAAQVAAAQNKYRPKDATQEKLEMDAKNFAENIDNFLYGATAEIKNSGRAYLVSKGAVIEVNPPGKPAGNYIMNPNGDFVLFETTGDPVKGGKAAVGALLTATEMTNLPEDLVVKNMKFGKFNTGGSGTGIAATRNYKSDVQAKLDADKQEINSDLFNDQDSVDTGAKLAEYFKDVDGVVVKPNTNLGFNDITITYTHKNSELKPIIAKLNANENKTTSKTEFTNFVKFINLLPDDVKEKFLGPETGTTETTATTGGTVQGGRTR